MLSFEENSKQHASISDERNMVSEVMAVIILPQIKR